MKSLTREVIVWLTNIHPVSRENHLVNLFFTRHLWEDFSFYRSWSVFNSVNDVGVEKVKRVCVQTRASVWIPVCGHQYIKKGVSMKGE